MICKNCDQEIEDGSAFCGSCGQPTGLQPNAAPQNSIPTYAVAKPSNHKGEIPALLSVIFGVIAVPAAVFMPPIVGIGLAMVGFILGTLTRRSYRRLTSTIGIAVSVLAIIVAFGVWAYYLTHKEELARKSNKPSGAQSSIESKSLIDTSCYALQFPFTLNTDHDEYDDCDVRVFEGESMEMSNNVYKIYANKAPTVNEANFEVVAKEAIKRDISATLPGFKVSGARVARFADSPAYIVNAEDAASGIAVVEAAVLHKTENGYNLFSLVHATKGDTTNLKDLEDAWRWK